MLKKVSNKQAAIKRDLHKVYQEISQEREPYCEGCGRSGVPLSNSHTISQARCKQLGKPELIFDKNNIFLECWTDSDSCHVKWESANIEKQMSLYNFQRKLAYIKIHDEEQYRKILMKIEEA